jgi:adenylate kinase
VGDDPVSGPEHLRAVRLALFGAPGVGKGTQAGILQERLALPHISTGDMLRAAIREGTPEGRQARAVVERGELIPDALISARLEREDVQEGFILDGFPRTVGQADYLDRTLEAGGRALDAVINITVPEAEIIERLGGRRVCPSCGASYHLRFHPPMVEGRCDACGGRLEQRADDADDVIRGRLEVYARQTAPVLEYYRRRGVLRDVDGVGRPEDVTGRIDALLAAPGR